MRRTPAYSSSPASAIRVDWEQPAGDTRSVRTRKRTKKVRQGTQVKPQYQGPYPVHVPDSTLRPSWHDRTQEVLYAPTFSPTVLWAPLTPIPDKYGKAPPTCLWASIVLWVPTFTVPGEHDKTPYIHPGTNSVADADVCHTRRRQHNLPRASDIQQCCGRLSSSCTR